MGLYDSGGTTVNYQPPQIEKDTSFKDWLEYQKGREQALEAKAANQEAEAKAKAAARTAAGAAGFSGLRRNVEDQLRQGLISYGDAASQLRDFASKYDLAPPEQDVADIQNIYTKELLPGRRKAGISAAYEELLGRQATEEEQTKAQERFNQGYYQTNQDLKDALTKSPEYQDKFQQSYLANYYDTQYGKELRDQEGKRTGTRAFKFDANLLPSYTPDTLAKTGVSVPQFKNEFIGTPAEIEEQQQNIRDTRQYLYSSGLTALQGDIDKQIQKMKGEQTLEASRIAAKSNVYGNLVSGFWG